MITTRTTEERFRLLGFLRAFLVQEEFESLYSNKGKEHLETFEDYFEGFMLASSEVGLDINPSAVLPQIEKYDQFAEFILENTILDESLASQIEDQFGGIARFNFVLAEAIMCVRLIASFRWSGKQRLPAKRQAFVRKQMGIAHEGLSGISIFLKESDGLIEKHLGPSYSQRCVHLADTLLNNRPTRKRLELADGLTESLLNDLVPNFGEIEERRARARRLGRAFKMSFRPVELGTI